MDREDLDMPSPKRRRTESPEESRSHPVSNLVNSLPMPNNDANRDIPDTSGLTQLPGDQEVKDATSTSVILPNEHDHESAPLRHNVDEHATRIEATRQEDGFLDMLMQHVEAESTPVPESTATDAVKVTQPSQTEDAPDSRDSTQKVPHQESRDIKANGEVNCSAETGGIEQADSEPTREIQMEEEAQQPIPAPPAADAPTLHMNEAMVDGATGGLFEVAGMSTDIQPTTDTTAAREAPEFEYDSSPLSSDTDTSSDNSSDDSDDEEDDDKYAMMDPAEVARMLMEDEGGSDDEGDKSRGKPTGAHVRTINERPEEVIPKPNITITEDMKIEELGSAEAIVESTVLVKAKVSGEYQVLEGGSLLCLKDRTVLGVVAETLGRVQQPMYTIRFTNDEAIKDAGLSSPGVAVYYVVSHSSFVFTQPLKGLKGTDASNFHDEEVGEDEMEFSDDEKEAEYKRQLKNKKRGLPQDFSRTPGRGRGRGDRGGHRGDRRGGMASTTDQSYANGTLEMSYDEAGSTEDGYTPLSRPTNLPELMTRNAPTEETSTFRPPLPPFTQPESSRGRFDDRGRGRGRGRGSHRGGRGGHFNQKQTHAHPLPPPPPAPQFSAQQPMQYPSFNHNQSYPTPPPQQSYNHQHLPVPGLNIFPPTTPSLTPQQNSYPTPFSPSPISPLPQQGWQQFPNQQAFQNFFNTQMYAQGQHMQPPPPPPPAGGTWPFAGAQGQGQGQGHGRWDQHSSGR